MEVEEGVFFTDMRPLDLITIISILCDNAIEATVLADKPKLSIAIFKMEINQLMLLKIQLRKLY